MSMMWKNLTLGQKKVWKIGAGVVAGGVVFKVTYFNFSRGVLVDHMDARHDKATNALKEAREFSRWAENDRKQREIPISDEQREQMREYLALTMDAHPHIVPKHESEATSRRR
eukprot:scaffold47095_cov49-Attheya_sp.AAC.4